MLGGITCAPSRLVYCCTEVGEGDQVYSEGGSPYTRHRAANSHWGQPPPTRHARQGCAQLVTGRKVAKWAIESTESTFLDKTILLSRGSLENFQIFIQLHPSLVRTGSWCWPIAARRQAASTVGRGGGGGERRRRGREKVADVALRKDMSGNTDTVYENSTICNRFHFYLLSEILICILRNCNYSPPPKHKPNQDRPEKLQLKARLLGLMPKIICMSVKKRTLLKKQFLAQNLEINMPPRMPHKPPTRTGAYRR